MDATLILIDSDAELARARALVDRLWQSNEPADVARLVAQARLIAAYEEGKWPRRIPSTADLIRHLTQHGAEAPLFADLLLAMPQDDGEFPDRISM
jgi:HTH-type transcriptional regulator / antitoxin HigA